MKQKQFNQIRKAVLVLSLVSCSSLTLASNLRVMVLGDMPYTNPRDFPRFERLIDEINKEKPDFSVFLGDTKSGSSPCTNEYAVKIDNYFNTFNQPLVYSIGDNEWTDCHRPAAGEYDPLERLFYLRSVDFKDTKSFGKTKLDLTRQADVMIGYKKFVENSLWIKKKFIFVSLHIPGSNNNFGRTPEADAEYKERNQANLAWIDYAFDTASNKKLDGVVFLYQADMFYSKGLAKDDTSGYKDTIQKFTERAEAFQKPVLLVNGDSHKLIIDQPIKMTNGKHVLENLYRLQVMGEDQIQAVEIEINKKANFPFSFRPFIVEKNNPKYND